MKLSERGKFGHNEKFTAIGPLDNDYAKLLNPYLTPSSPERRRSSDSSVEGEEDKLNRNYFPNSKTESRRSASNGIDCKFLVLSGQSSSLPMYFMTLKLFEKQPS